MIWLYIWRYMIAVLIYDCRFDVKTDVLVGWKWIFMQKATCFCIFIQRVAFCFLYLISVNIITNYKQIPLFAYTFQSWYFSFEKAWVSPPETHAFTSWNPWFHSLKPMLSDRNLMPFWKRCPVLQQKPLPRAAPARLSPPLMEGSEWLCKLWINNCIANYSRTVVSVPRPPAPNLQQAK